ncbi:MAG: DNA mismatch repair endonuclease MutL [bacterium]|nr:DNA mismatch repair endonuclease MutL [bacterium]
MSAPQTHKIQRLSETVANQIAAGEVVERPASVVKELVENALDAGATQITIEVDAGGVKRIHVEDNGCGMSREDALLSLERQATSKISTSHDIERIATFGFRGEAIPSIASVSRFQLMTRTADDEAATEMLVVGGTTERVVDVGHPVGTTIVVRDLFFNVPARRKFLRTAATELSRIRQTLIAIALAHPMVAMTLIADGRTLFRLPMEDTLADRVRVLLGDGVLDGLLPIEDTHQGVTVTGYISRVDFVRGGTPEQYIFVNRRPATAPQIQYALREAWPNKERRPVAVLFVDLPPEEVDVNVHPAKREVRFRHGNWVADAVAFAIQRALTSTLRTPSAPSVVSPSLTALTTPITGTTIAPLSPIAPLPTPQMPTASPVSTMPQPRQTTLQLPEAPVNPYPSLRELPTTETVSFDPPPPAPEAEVKPTTLPWKWVRVADLSPQGLWLVVTDQGYVTVDARGVIERIYYERFVAQNEPITSQPLLIPETLRLPPVDAERVLRYLSELEACGFGISSFGDDTFMVDALPVFFAHCAPKEILADIATELDGSGVRKTLDAWRREVVARAAAQAAARTIKTDSVDVAERLMRELAQCEMPYTTPRGRPTMILTTYTELLRRFRR